MRPFNSSIMRSWLHPSRVYPSWASEIVEVGYIRLRAWIATKLAIALRRDVAGSAPLTTNASNDSIRKNVATRSELRRVA
jgi:hypothetical protein